VIAALPFQRILIFSINLLLLSSAAANDSKRVILLETMPVPAVLEHSRWFQTQLQESGYVEGENLNLSILKAEGDRELAEELLSAELAKGDPDLVVTIATLASQTAAKLLKDTDVPILFFQVSDPVGAGLLEQLNVPTGTNITGKIYTVSREAKIEMILRLVSQTVTHTPIRFGFIHSTYPSALGDLRELKNIEKIRDDIVLVPYEIQYKEVPAGLPAMIEETRNAVQELADIVDFWMEPSGPLGETSEYTEILLEHSTVPIAFGMKLDSVKMGALIHVTPNMEASGREAALVAVRILTGENPGQIPVTPPSDFDLGLNLATALRLNIVVPPDILQLAGEHVYR
jgi:putative ABC transport system substrate-binding protein